MLPGLNLGTASCLLAGIMFVNQVSDKTVDQNLFRRKLLGVVHPLAIVGTSINISNCMFR